MSHATEHVTDVGVFRLRVSQSDEAIVFGWDYPGATLLRVRILRSRERFADGPEEAAGAAAEGPHQAVVYEDVTGSFRDSEVQPGTTYFYTLFARHVGHTEARQDAAAGTGPEGSPLVSEPEAAPDEWTLWARERVRAATPKAARLRLALARLLGRA